MAPPPIRQVSDTALWVAMYRAYESERRDALFHDPLARRMAGARGEAIVQALPFGKSLGWPVIVRTAVMDEIILRYVAQGTRTVVNLGAGLDTRAFRLPLPASLNWLDVDLPTVVDYRRVCLKGATPACNHAHLAADVTDAAQCANMLAAARENGGPLLIVTEGLLVYLSSTEVSVLARRLGAERLARWWLTDLVTPWTLATLGYLLQPYMGAAVTGFQFAPGDHAGFFERLGWREIEFRSGWDESIRLNRCMPFAPQWNVLWKRSWPPMHEGMRQMSSVVLLDNTWPPSPGGPRVPM